MEQDNSNPKDRITKIELIIFGLLFFGILFLSVFMFFCEYYPFSQGPPATWTRDLLSLIPFMAAPIIVGSIGIVFVPVMLSVCLFVKKAWRIRLILLSILPVMCLLVGVGLYNIVPRFVPQFRQNACKTIVSRGQVLIDAISSYQQDNDGFPKSLEALVPAYIDKIPETGVRGFPYFEYEILDPDGFQCSIFETGYKPMYELKVELTQPFKWDCIFYWPVEKYPDYIYGGYTEKIGNWAYVNE